MDRRTHIKTGRTNRAALIEAIKGLYRASGLAEPIVVVVPSPFVMAINYGLFTNGGKFANNRYAAIVCATYAATSLHTVSRYARNVCRNGLPQRVTQRMPQQRVTQRMPQRVTQRLPQRPTPQTRCRNGCRNDAATYAASMPQRMPQRVTD